MSILYEARFEPAFEKPTSSLVGEVEVADIEPAETRLAIFEWIEGGYNPHRRHSALGYLLGYLSPIDYERKLMITEKRAA